MFYVPHGTTYNNLLTEFTSTYHWTLRGTIVKAIKLSFKKLTGLSINEPVSAHNYPQVLAALSLSTLSNCFFAEWLKAQQAVAEGESILETLGIPDEDFDNAVAEFTGSLGGFEPAFATDVANIEDLPESAPTLVYAFKIAYKDGYDWAYLPPFRAFCLIADLPDDVPLDHVNIQKHYAHLPLKVKIAIKTIISPK